MPIPGNRAQEPFMDISGNHMDPTQENQREQLQAIENQQGEDNNVGQRAAKWQPTLCCPYMPGLSERLHFSAARFGIRTWFTYGGNLSENFSGVYKDKYHISKAHYSVYSLACQCGTRYIGESGRNLKIHVNEHKQRSSKSALSLHIHEDREEQDGDHQIQEDSATVITQERNLRKRRFIESACIKAKAAQLCNNGPSVYVSDVWNPTLSRLARSLSALD